MKKLVSAALAASLLATPLIAAPASAAPRHDDRGRAEQRYDDRGRGDQRSDYRNNGQHRSAQAYRPGQVRHWQRGERFDSRYSRNYRQIRDPRAYRLYDAPRGYSWVQSDNDAVLVAIASGLIGAVVGNAF
ncbi:RcnB family protein [Sphingosinicella sp. CPCC 101087]|uniref:RcnB family protein n=1 Tax=Sphingosinicella sp. CPCC 101087 TaxID=2497754 RepID=UPI00101BC308|nr:RcnB family protein [Sphingosinicella sp. CPCC 101087]